MDASFARRRMMPTAPVWRSMSKEETMSDVHILAIDLAKRSFQVCGTDRGGAVLFSRTLSRGKLMQMLDAQEPCKRGSDRTFFARP